MNYRKMNATGIYVSDLCLGTMTFGAQTEEKEAINIIDYAIDQGINFIDTADIYNNRVSERIVGKALKGKRQDIILATKVGFKNGSNPNDYGLNRRHILKTIDESLKNLQTDYIDIYYMHRMDPKVEFEETLETMTTLIRSGKVRYLGISNFPAWQLCEMMWMTKQKDLIPPIVTQNMYNLLTRDIEAELVPCMDRHKIGLTIYNPIAGGMLSGKYDFTKKPEGNTRFALKPNYMDRYWHEDNFDAIRKFEDIATANNMSLLALSYQWCLSHSFVDSVICGVSKLEQLKQNIEAVTTTSQLDEKTMQACNEIGNALMKKRFCYFK